MAKRTIRLTERDLHRIIKESVRLLIEDIEEQGNNYDSYIIIDQASEEQVGPVYDADELEYAIQDAHKMPGRLVVIGCNGNQCDYNNVVYDTNPGSDFKF